MGLIVISLRMRGDPRWRGLATYTLVSGIALAIMWVGFGVLVAPDDAALHAWAGLYQRVLLAVWFPAMIALALRLLRVAR